MDASLFDLVIGFVSLPFQLIRYVMFAALDFVVFNVLNLGTYLPIQLGS